MHSSFFALCFSLAPPVPVVLGLSAGAVRERPHAAALGSSSSANRRAGGAPRSSAVPGAEARSSKEGKSGFSWAPEQFCGLVSAVLHKR